MAQRPPVCLRVLNRMRRGIEGLGEQNSASSGERLMSVFPSPAPLPLKC